MELTAELAATQKLKNIFYFFFFNILAPQNIDKVQKAQTISKK